MHCTWDYLLLDVWVSDAKSRDLNALYRLSERIFNIHLSPYKFHGIVLYDPFGG